MMHLRVELITKIHALEIKKTRNLKCKITIFETSSESIG